MLKQIELSKMKIAALSDSELQELNGGGIIDSLFYYAGAILHMAYNDATNPNYKQDQGSAAMNAAFN